MEIERERERAVQSILGAETDSYDVKHRDEDGDEDMTEERAEQSIRLKTIDRSIMCVTSRFRSENQSACQQFLPHFAASRLSRLPSPPCLPYLYPNSKTEALNLAMAI
jgi:hypothetical protein